MDNVKIQQLKRGTLEMILLSLISKHGCSYGYAILNELDKIGDDFFRNSKPGTVYPVLYRLESEGLIKVMDEQGLDSQKKKYKITVQGQKALENMISIWNHYVLVVGKFI